MDKQIPIYFDSVVISSPIEMISDTTPNVGRLKVRVFTKYGNRNGSYITEAVANQLIESATNKMTPVVGFFDPSTQSWASHTGPTLANAYGYVEEFLGWEPFEDTDGITREYAVFSVILFTDYFEEAKKIYGQNQSMELDPTSIEGDWASIDGNEYFVYTTAKMLGFCVIGEHEPCFSVSSFFAKNDGEYSSQTDKFASLLFDLKATVDACTKNNNGGEQPMNEVDTQEVVEVVEEEETSVENPQAQEPDTFQVAEEEPEVVESTNEPTVEEVSTEPSEFELLQEQFSTLQEQFNTLQNSFNELSNNYSAVQQQLEDATNEVNELRTQNEQLQTSICTYEAQIEEAKTERKNILINKYAKIMSEEEISDIRDKMNDFSYDELESKLAIAFANAKMADGAYVPLPDPEESQFSLLMKKYRKH